MENATQKNKTILDQLVILNSLAVLQQAVQQKTLKQFVRLLGYQLGAVVKNSLLKVVYSVFSYEICAFVLIKFNWFKN